MRTVKNIEDKDLKVSFEFETYEFPSKKAISVPNKLFDHLKERYPLAFAFKPELKKKEKATRVKKKKTTAYVKPRRENLPDATSSMRATKAGAVAPTFGKGVDLTPPSGATDSDGVGWYGEGIVIEQKPSTTFN